MRCEAQWPAGGRARSRSTLMTWFVIIVSTLTTAAIGLVGTGFVANLCVSWYRISGFEGGSGYFVVGLALLGGVLGFILGAVTSLVATFASERFSGWSPCFLSWGIALLLLLVATGLCRSLADIPPRFGANRVTLEVELRLPAGAPRPAPSGSSWLMLSSDLHGLRESTVGGRLNVEQAREENGRWIVPGDVRVHTKRGRLWLAVMIDGVSQPHLPFELPGRITDEHSAWSGWLPHGTADAPWPESHLTYRSRLLPVLPPPPPLSSEEVDRARLIDARAQLDALEPDGPLVQWLPFVTSWADADLRTRAIDAIAARPSLRTDLATLVVDDDAETAAAALRMIEYLPASPEDLHPIVVAAGADLAEHMRRFNASTVEEDPGYEGAADVSRRFNGWIVAARALRARREAADASELASDMNKDLESRLATILELSRLRPDSQAMRQDVCRVASFHLHEWTGTAPLPGDPPPR